MAQRVEHFDEPVLQYARTDFPVLRQDMTVQQALDAIRQQGIGEKIIYFYVVDDQEHLAGVLPTRRFLTAPVDQKLADIMIRQVFTIPHNATVLQACEHFVMHKFLAFPVVDDEQHIVGVINVDLLTTEVFDIAERESMDELFEAIGFHVEQVRGASPLRAFRYRFPWLLATLGAGLTCAFLVSAFELTLAKSLALAFFLTMVLALGESVSVQSINVTIQALRTMRPTLRWYIEAFRREASVALLLGLACGGIVGLIVWFWMGKAMLALVIGSSIFLTLVCACLLGLSVPALLHALKLDPKISSGPVALALTDVLALVFYFTLAAMML